MADKTFEAYESFRRRVTEGDAYFDPIETLLRFLVEECDVSLRLDEDWRNHPTYPQNSERVPPGYVLRNVGEDQPKWTKP